MNAYIVRPIQRARNQKSLERMFVFRIECFVCDDVN